MHNFRQTLKYNKKVYIVPHDKLHTVMGEASKDDISTHSTVDLGGASQMVHDNPASKKSLGTREAGEVKDWRHSLSPTQLRSAMALMHILGFEPETSKRERSYLLYTQLDTSTPENVIDLYHKLSEKEIPLYLIGNKHLKDRMKSMRNLREDAYEDSEHDSPNESQASGSSGEEPDLTKALLLYANSISKQKKKKKKQKTKRKRQPNANGDTGLVDVRGVPQDTVFGIKKSKNDSGIGEKEASDDVSHISPHTLSGGHNDWLHIF